MKLRGVCPKCGAKLIATEKRTRWPAAFDRAFALMDRAFAEVRRGFRALR